MLQEYTISYICMIMVKILLNRKNTRNIDEQMKTIM